MSGSISTAALSYNYLAYVQSVTHYLDRYTGPEAKVALFCIERTIRFNKRSERIPMRHMLEGIPEVVQGIGLAKNTVKRALKGLENKGFLVVHNRKRPQGRDAAPEIEIVCKMSKLRIGKKHRAKELGRGQSLTGEGSIADNLKEDTLKEENSSSSRTTRAVHAVVNETKKSGRVRRKNKAQQQLTKSVNTGNVAQAWRQLCIEYGFAVPSFTKKIVGRVTGQLRHHERSIDDTYEFMEWCIQNWSLLKKKEFKNWELIKSKPEISVWGMAMSQFVGFYATREYYDKVDEKDLPAVTTNELERQLEARDAELYTLKGKLSFSERIVEHLREKKNGKR